MGVGALHDAGIVEVGTELDVVNELGGAGNLLPALQARGAGSDEPVLAHGAPPAAITASMMERYPVQRQRLPASASLTSSSVGWGLSRSSSVAVRITPGAQNPHWNASWAMHDSWSSVRPSAEIPFEGGDLVAVDFHRRE